MPSELPDTTIGTIDTTVAIEKQRKRRETATLKKATKTTETTLENEIRAALSILQENSTTEDSDSIPADVHRYSRIVVNKGHLQGSHNVKPCRIHI